MIYDNGSLKGIIGINDGYYKVESGKVPEPIKKGTVYGFKQAGQRGGAITLRNHSSSRKTARRHFANMLDKLMIQENLPI